MSGNQLPIGVYDSGFGGISVLEALATQLPNENFLYYGDNAHAPYGTKTPEEVLKRSEAVLCILKRKGIKALVIACNTATAASAEILRKKHPEMPIIGIEPALKPAALCMDHPHVLIMATPMTLHLEKFKILAERFRDTADFYMLPCPGLVELIENGKANCDETETYLRTMLSPYLDDPPDAVVLGCTHFPFVKETISKLLGKKVRFFDGAEGTARQLKKRLEDAGLLNYQTEKGSIVFYSSKRSKAATATMKMLFERKF